MIISYTTILKCSYMIHKNAKSMMVCKNLLVIIGWRLKAIIIFML